MFRLTPVVKNILIINVILLLVSQMTGLQIMGRSLNDLFALHYIQGENFSPFQLVTHMFMHAGFMHLLSNMIGLIVFGPKLEWIWGPKRFLLFYFVTGLGAAALQMTAYFFELSPKLAIINDYLQDPSLAVFKSIMDSNSLQINPRALMEIQNNIESTALLNPDRAIDQSVVYMGQIQEFLLNSYRMVGASGAVLGIAMGFALYFPNTEMVIFPIMIPVKAKYLVIFYFLYEFYSIWAASPSDNVAHFAHIGGMVFGYLLIRYWNSKRNRFW